MLRKKKEEKLSIEQADIALQNIFAACNMPPNTIPFDKIVLRQKVNTLFFKVSISVASAALLLTLLAPLPFLLIDSKIHHLKGSSIEILSDGLYQNTIFLQSASALSVNDCYIIHSDGTASLPAAYDSLTKTIYFPYARDCLSVHLETETGVTAVVLISPNGKS